MNKLVFIIGMRRSGTSILRTLIEKHPEVKELKFEPHELLFCASTLHINRYKDSKYHERVLNQYKGHEDKYFGAKLVINPGLETFSWKFIARMFPEAKFIFITRDAYDNYKSWEKQDKNSVRGIFNYGLYEQLHNHIVNDFYKFDQEGSHDSCVLSYENLINNTDDTLYEAWDTLGLEWIKGFNQYIKKPEFKNG